ncbi:hypothetical protein EV191_102398 [Tamaricihabitans halophyticus]|uniref:Uncharacterized protein n=1 Tax=Tamaricihabitans halophyticus TaxID=1262583 RepID=A0A4V2SUM1_9PSEU|nr:TFIIB-type zinc ribbon-containing protein [Tamaricihabitans halophyticus]TCP55186.1 hypothetical protein EV191_102398 [Tamaricihabitans halophyticus]
MTETSDGQSDRFTDPLVRLWRYADRILVRCPKCAGCASVLPEPTTTARPGPSNPHRRLSCLGCGHTAGWTAPRHDNYWIVPELNGPDDPYFGLPLWLRAECCGGNVLWAYNAEHLALLESYLAARLRERGAYRGSMSLVERLPAWLKSAKHRTEALRTIRRLRTTLPAD